MSQYKNSLLLWANYHHLRQTSLWLEISISKIRLGKWLHEAINILDLIFKNNPNIIHTYSSVPTNPISSHYLVTSVSPLSSNTIPTTCKKDSDYIIDTLNLFSEYTKWANIKEILGKVNWATALHGLTSVEMTKIL